MDGDLYQRDAMRNAQAEGGKQQMTDDLTKARKPSTDVDRLLSFAPVINAIDSANSSELAELAKIRETLKDVANKLDGASNAPAPKPAPDADNGGLVIKRVARTTRAKEENQEKETGKPEEKKSGRKNNASNSQAEENEKKSRAKTAEIAQASPAISDLSVIGEKEEKETRKPLSRERKQKENREKIAPVISETREITEKTVTSKEENKQKTAPDKKVSPEKENKEKTSRKPSQQDRAIQEAMAEMRGFYRDERGRLRRENGQFASKAERRRYSASEQANKEAEERRKGGSEGKDEEKKATGIMQRLGELLKSKIKGDSIAENEATDAAGTAAGSSYWRSAVELYKTAQAAKEAKDNVSEKLFGKGKKAKPAEGSATPERQPEITQTSAAGAVLSVRHDNQPAPRVGLSRNGRAIAGGSKVAGSLAAKDRATAALGVKQTKAQTQVLKDNHAELLEAIEDLTDEVGDKGKSKGGILGSITSAILGGEGGGGILGDLLTAGAAKVGWDKAKKWRENRKAKKAEKQAAKNGTPTKSGTTTKPTSTKPTGKRGRVARRGRGGLLELGRAVTDGDCACTTPDLDLGRNDNTKTRKQGKGTGKDGKQRKTYGKNRRTGKAGKLARFESLPDVNTAEKGRISKRPSNAKPLDLSHDASVTTDSPRRTGRAVEAKTPTGKAASIAESKGAAKASKAAGAVAKGTAVAGGAAESAGVLSKLGGKGLIKGGAKALGMGVRAIPLVGQIASLGHAAMSYTDTEGQRAAFGLQEGQEVTGQQKASYAIADAITGGGLLVDGANALGTGLRSIGLDRIGEKMENLDMGDAAEAVDNGITAVSDGVKSLFSRAKDTLNTVSLELAGRPMFDSGKEKLKGDVSDDAADQRLAKYDHLFEAAGAKHGVSPALLKSMAKTESAGNPFAVSPKGAGGLMQFMPNTAAQYGVKNRFDPSQSIEGSAKYMAYLLKRYDGDEKVALSAYNYGEGNVDKAKKKTNGSTFEQIYRALPQETRNYAPKILAQREKYADPLSGLPSVFSKETQPQALAQAPAKQEAALSDLERVTAIAKEHYTKAGIAIPNLLPSTIDIGQTAAKAGDSKADPMEVVAQTDPAVVKALNQGMDRVVKAIETSAKAGGNAPATATPAPRGKVPRNFGDADMDTYMRDA